MLISKILCEQSSYTLNRKRNTLNFEFERLFLSTIICLFWVGEIIWGLKFLCPLNLVFIPKISVRQLLTKLSRLLKLFKVYPKNSLNVSRTAKLYLIQTKNFEVKYICPNLRISALKSVRIEHFEIKIIVQSGMFENEIAPGVL